MNVDHLEAEQNFEKKWRKEKIAQKIGFFINTKLISFKIHVSWCAIFVTYFGFLQILQNFKLVYRSEF